MKKTSTTTISTSKGMASEADDRLWLFEYGQMTLGVRDAFRVLLRAIFRHEMEEQDSEGIVSVLGRLTAEEWRPLLRLCIHHEIAPLAYPIVQSMSARTSVPVQVLALWRDNALFRILYHEKMKQSFREAMEALRGTELKPVLTKGLRMAMLYSEPGLRHCVDIDLFSGRDEYARTAACLHAAGYTTPRRDITNPVHEEFHYPGRVTLELHRKLIHPWYFPANANFWYDAFMANARRDEVNGETVWLSSPGDELVFQVVHLIRHYLSGGAFMKLFLDLAVLVGKGMEPDDCTYAAGMMKRLGFYPAACRLLAMAAGMTGMRVPEAFVEGADVAAALWQPFEEDLFLLEEVAGEEVKRWQHGLVHFYLFSRGRLFFKPVAYVLQSLVDVFVYHHGWMDSFRFNVQVYRRYRKRETVYRLLGLLPVKPMRTGA